MTPAEFIAKWQASTRNERSACQEHFIDLCHLLDEPTPNSDPTGEDYAFEKGATKFTGEDGWADVWRRNRFAWEYKKKRGDLNAAYRQLLLRDADRPGDPPPVAGGMGCGEGEDRGGAGGSRARRSAYAQRG